MAFDPSQINVVPSAEMMKTVMTYVSMFIYFVVIVLVALFLVKLRKYKIPAEIFELRGNAIVKIKNTKLREIIKDNHTKYEVRTLIGLFSKKMREFYYNTDDCYKIPTRKGYMFYLLKMGFNAYNPMKVNAYTNEIEKIDVELKRIGITKGEKKELTKKQKEIMEMMKHDRDLKESRYTYVPIPFASDDSIEFEPIPQNLLPVLAREVRETNQMYSSQKWFEPYLFPLSIFALCIVQIIVMGWMFDKVGEVGGACQSAKDSIIDVARQKLT